MTAPVTIEIASRLHGPRKWTRLAVEARRAPGVQVVREHWESRCVVCGSPFVIIMRPKGGHGFEIVTCPEHRLSRAEVVRLLNARDQRQAFEEIRRAKLGK
jgi:hypothetical protein